MTAIDHAANAEQLDIALYGKPEIYTPPEAYMPRRTLMAETLALMYPARHGVDQMANAEKLLGDVDDILDEAGRASFGEREGALALIESTRAQAAATLALAEQQRLANVIALESMPTEQHDRLSINTSVTAIREGLGLS